MFTGIVAAVGRIAARAPTSDGARVRLDAAGLDLDDVSVGDSIAVAGCCLTVVGIEPPLLDFDVSGETLRCTAGFDVGRAVNLEQALRLSDRLGGHLMSGHVDGVGIVAACAPVTGDCHGNWRLEIDAPATLVRYVAPKGSIAVDGVSLTTNTVAGARFTLNLIPHTLAVTTLGELAAGTRVNLEVDLIARYVERLRAAP
ncbi:MAG TPA: riboflavin synthase [Casimicrobiaceae bacterium]